jgi:hypothetical protein
VVGNYVGGDGEFGVVNGMDDCKSVEVDGKWFKADSKTVKVDSKWFKVDSKSSKLDSKHLNINSK